MGLTAFSGDFPTAKDIAVAKNYLSADELKILNNLVSGYFDFAEIQAMRSAPRAVSDAKRVAARTYIFLPIYCEVAVVYLLFCTVITKLQGLLERQLNAHGFQ